MTDDASQHWVPRSCVTPPCFLAYICGRLLLVWTDADARY